MLQGKVYGVYFSPTGGTRAYVTALAGLLSCEAEEIDLTAGRSGRGTMSLARRIW